MSRILTPADRNTARDILNFLPLLHGRALKLGLYRTARTLNEAIREAGWEWASIEKEQEVKIHMNPCKPMEHGPTAKWVEKFIAAHNGDLNRAHNTASKEFVATNDPRRVTFWAAVSRELIRKEKESQPLMAAGS